MHILDVAENGIAAGASLIEVIVDEEPEEDRLFITIADNGRGMDADFLRRVLDPFVTTRVTRKVGMGLSLFQQSAQEADGDLEIESSPGNGTVVRVHMSYGHIDRRPMGAMAETMVTLIQGSPEVDFKYVHKHGSEEFVLDTRTIKSELEDVPINNLEVIGFLRESIRMGLKEIGAD